MAAQTVAVWSMGRDLTLSTPVSRMTGRLGHHATQPRAPVMASNAGPTNLSNAHTGIQCAHTTSAHSDTGSMLQAIHRQCPPQQVLCPARFRVRICSHTPVANCGPPPAPRGRYWVSHLLVQVLNLPGLNASLNVLGEVGLVLLGLLLLRRRDAAGQAQAAVASGVAPHASKCCNHAQQIPTCAQQ